MNYRQLKSLLRRRGYIQRSGKGSHSIWTHPRLPGKPLVLCGRNHEDVPFYQLARAGLRRQKGYRHLL
ncbi:MAG TPA: type II toxin-antitoxin system HicA family toxin [Ktedonobacteraceae bacterium]|nr:type II toxin-antitoxin system HicA family toxin [Ktedonobacteraceae bacterium]